jgi:hypothetical protein
MYSMSVEGESLWKSSRKAPFDDKIEREREREKKKKN